MRITPSGCTAGTTQPATPRAGHHHPDGPPRGERGTGPADAHRTGHRQPGYRQRHCESVHQGTLSGGSSTAQGTLPLAARTDPPPQGAATGRTAWIPQCRGYDERPCSRPKARDDQLRKPAVHAPTVGTCCALGRSGLTWTLTAPSTRWPSMMAARPVAGCTWQRPSVRWARSAPVNAWVTASNGAGQPSGTTATSSTADEKPVPARNTGHRSPRNGRTFKNTSASAKSLSAPATAPTAHRVCTNMLAFVVRCFRLTLRSGSDSWQSKQMPLNGWM